MSIEKPTTLFALDFDFTTIDEDSDHYIFEQLSPVLFKKATISETDERLERYLAMDRSNEYACE